MPRYQNRIDVLQGTLDLIVLQTLRRGPQHGYGISLAINAHSNDAFKVETGSLYPALHRLELAGAIKAKWGVSENNRKAKYYEITKRGLKAAAEQHDAWERLGAAVDRVLAK